VFDKGRICDCGVSAVQVRLLGIFLGFWRHARRQKQEVKSEEGARTECVEARSVLEAGVFALGMDASYSCKRCWCGLVSRNWVGRAGTKRRQCCDWRLRKHWISAIMYGDSLLSRTWF